MKLHCVAIGLCAAVLAIATPASAETFKPSIDVDGSGDLSIREFVLGFAAFDMGRFDANKDEVLSIKEFLKADTKWTQMLVKRFNKDKDDVFSTEELVDMYLFIFTNRDKDESGTITIEEAPRSFLSA